MANDLTGPIWKVDTASATPLYSNICRVRGIRWVSKTAVAGDDAEIQDVNGKTIWASVASGANYVESDASSRLSNGLVVPVLDSGYLLLEMG